MTWPRATPGNLSYVKQDPMGVAATIEHFSSSALMELRQEVAQREKCKKELEFLEKGRNPLDFDHNECVPASDILLGILVSVKAGQHTPMAPLTRNGDTCESNEEVHKVRLKYEKKSLSDSQKSETPTPALKLKDPPAPVANGVVKSPREEQAPAAGTQHVPSEKEKAVSELLASLSAQGPEPQRRMSHWDYVLTEMAWMANDFFQEHLWKRHAASQMSSDAAKVARSRLAASLQEKVDVPSTPDVEEERVRLFFKVPHGASEAFRQSIELSSSLKAAVQEETSLDSKVERQQPTVSSEEDVFPVSNLGVRPRPGKKPKKNKKSLNVVEETDSENDDWIPDSPEKVKRRKENPPPAKPSSYKKPQLPLRLPNKDARKNNLRKGDMFQAQPGQEWSSQEDQYLVILESDLGANWNWLSDILNTGWHIKGRYRSAEKCKERHAYLAKYMQVQRNSFDGPPGSSMVMLEKIHRPVEKDTMIYHFEQLIEAKKNNTSSEKPKDNILRQVLMEPHESLDLKKLPYRSPLELAEVANKEISRALSLSQKKQSKNDLLKDLGRGDKNIIAVLDEHEQKATPEKSASELNVQQRQPDQGQQITPKVQVPPCATSQQHLGGPSSYMEQQRRNGTRPMVMPRNLSSPMSCSTQQLERPLSTEQLPQNFGSAPRQRGPPVSPMPRCSTSHQQVMFPGGPEQHNHFQQGNQHMQMQRGVRMPPQPNVQASMQANLQYNHRGLAPLAQPRYNGSPPVPGQWRMYNQTMPGVRPSVRLPNGGMSPQLIQQQHQHLQLQRRRQQDLRMREQTSNGQPWPQHPPAAPS